MKEITTDLLVSHFQSLTPECRRLRFGRSMNDSALERYATDVIDKAKVFPVFDGDVLIGLAEVADADDWVEGAFSVNPEYRGRGLGGGLLKTAINEAEAQGKPLVLYVDPDNGPMRKLAAKQEFQVVAKDYDLVTYLKHLL